MASLSDIPFLGGYLGQQAVNRTAGDDVLKQAGGYMTLAGQAQEQQAKVRAAQEQGAIRSILESDAPPEAKQQALLRIPGGIAILEHMTKVQKEQQQVDLTKQMMGNGGIEAMSTEQLGALVPKLAVAGHPGVAAVQSLYEKRRATEAARAQMPLLQSQAQPVTEQPVTDAGGIQRSQVAPGGPMVAAPPMSGPAPVGVPVSPEPVPPEVAAAAASGQPFSIGVGPSANPAENVTKVGGMFAPYLNSPNPAIRNAAAMYQARLNNMTPEMLTPQMLTTLENRARDLAMKDITQQGPHADPLVQVMRDGKPTFVRRSEVVSGESTPVNATTLGDAAASRETNDPAYMAAKAAQAASGEPLNQIVSGYGKEALQKRNAIDKEATALIKRQNPSMTDAQVGEELANRRIDYVAGRRSITQLATMLGATRQAVDQLDFNVKKVTAAMDKLGGSGLTDLSPVINAIARGEEKWTGNPAYSELYYYMFAAGQESARILSGGQASIAQLHQGAADEARKWADANMTTPKAWKEGVAPAMLAEGQERLKTYQRAIQAQRPGGAQTPAEAPAQAPRRIKFDAKGNVVQ